MCLLSIFSLSRRARAAEYDGLDQNPEECLDL